MNHVQEFEIEKLINNINQNKSPGPCNIPAKILKDHVDLSKQTLTCLSIFHFSKVYFQSHSKLQGWFLSLKKILIFIPSLFCQLLADCMKNGCSRLYAFLTKYDLFFKKQFGFRNNHSTSHAWVSPVDLIKKHLDNYYFVCRVLIDL